MDACVKRAVVMVVVGGHGGWLAGVGRPARRQRQLVTLRCAGRDRRTVSGRELPRTRVASRDRIVESRGSSGGSTPAAPLQRVGGGLQAAVLSSSCRRGVRVMLAQINPVSSRATATF